MADEAHVENHESFIKSPQQLAVVVFLAFAVPIAIIILLSQFVTGTLKTDPSDPAMAEEAIAKRIKPAGEIVFAAGGAAPAAAAPAPAAGGSSAAPAPAAAAATDGKSVYDKVCAVCHGAGIAGAPKAGDKAAWGARIAQGKSTLYDHAIKGIRAMPAKGGNAALSDGEVKAAVDVLVGMTK
ncbi:MAG: c-type cytochrome [Burkholderiales bacterium]